MSKYKYVEVLKKGKCVRRLNMTYLKKEGQSLVFNSLKSDGLIVRSVESEEELETGTII